MKSISLYNQDKSLRSEAQLLISTKPDDVSRGEWRKNLKEFRSKLSPEDLREFERHRQRKQEIRWETKYPEKVKQKNANWRGKNPEKIKRCHSNWRANNPEKVKQLDSKWYAENIEKAKEHNARWYAANTEKAKAYSIKWYQENTKKAKEANVEWRAKNQDYLTSYMKDYYHRRKSKDPLYHLEHNMRNACSRVVKELSLGKKPTSTFKWVGCSSEELKAHLESLFTEGMTWENYGKCGWHVDHIRPVCSFSAEEWEQVNYYTNLQPLWAEDNLTKRSSDIRQKRKKETR